MTKASSDRAIDPAESDNFSAEERMAMKERAAELRGAKKRGGKKGDGAADLLAKIAEMPDADREIAAGVHQVIIETAPDLELKTWYGMPAYARDGKVLCFFQAADKFKARYATFGFNDTATLDDGDMWPVTYALIKFGPAQQELIRKLIIKALATGLS